MTNKEYHKKWRAKNAERLKVNHKKWYFKNAERIKEYQKKYRQENAEKLREYYRAYREKNHERIAEWQKRYSNSPKGQETRKKCAKAYYEAHKNDPEYKEKKKAATARWQKKNREKLTEYNRQRRKRLAAEKWKVQG